MASIGRRRGERLLREFGEEVRAARLMAGVSQSAVARAAGVSQATVSRAERARRPYPDLMVLATVARIVGLDLTLKLFPAAGSLRDQAHIGLIRRFLEQLPASIPRRLEAAIGMPGDQRAWDVLLHVGGLRIGVAAETRIRDLQALLRREGAKMRDDGVDILILLVADTRANRLALREASGLLEAQLPLDTRAVMAALRRGEAPAASGIVIC